MTHVLRAHGLFNTATDAVAHMQLRTPFPWAGTHAEVTNLRNKLHHRECLDTADRAILIGCVEARKSVLNVIGATAAERKIMAECDKIIAFAQ
jgi:hypothetical protein